MAWLNCDQAMLVYRDLNRWMDPQEVLHRIARSAEQQLAHAFLDGDIVMGALMEFGEIETALVDRLCTDGDGFTPKHRALREISQALATLFFCAWRKHAPSAGLDSLPRRLHRLGDELSGERLQTRIPEGFAFYALHPASYLIAAEAFAYAYPYATAVCIGLRSIGTPLSAIVAATLQAHACPVHSYTIRPRGDPFSRQPVINHSLSILWRTHARRSAHFLLIDEGPGLSGSSLCGTADCLQSFGIPEHHIHFFPSHDPDPARLLSPSARTRWPRHRRFLAPFDPNWAIPARWQTDMFHDISAGKWRDLVYAGPVDYPAVQAQHERRKYLCPSANVLVKFAGFGPYGHDKFRRATELAQARWIPPPLGSENGFIAQRFVPGTPLRKGDLDADLLNHAAAYFAFLQRRFACDNADLAAILRMAETNIAEAVGAQVRSWRVFVAANRPWLEGCPAVALDGHVQPHEWIRTEHGIMKADALDHHTDHFYPGVADIAWDLAAFACEFELTEDGLSRLMERFRRLSGDQYIGARLPCYSAAYAAFRLGYARLAAQTLGDTAEGRRFAALSHDSLAKLRTALARLNP